MRNLTLDKLFTYWSLKGYEFDPKEVYRTDDDLVMYATIKPTEYAGINARVIYRMRGGGNIGKMVSSEILFAGGGSLIKNATLRQLMDHLT